MNEILKICNQECLDMYQIQIIAFLVEQTYDGGFATTLISVIISYY